MSIRQWWSRLTHVVRPRRTGHAREQEPARTRAQQDSDREAQRLVGMSAEDQAWEQSSLQRDRERQERARAAEGTPDR